MRALPRWLRRGLAVGLVFALLAIVAALSVLPVWRLGVDYDERIAEVRRQLGRFAVQDGQQERLRADLRRLQVSGAGGRYYLQGKTEALAAADLQRVVKRAVTANKGTLTSTQVVPTDDAEVRRVVLRVRMRGDINAVQRAFHALETGQPYLFLDNVKVRTWAGGRSGRRGAALQAAKLDVNFDLMGYLMSNAPGGGAT